MPELHIRVFRTETATYMGDDSSLLCKQGSSSMSTQPPLEHDELVRRISRDLADGYDEELEMEIEDHHPLPGVSSSADGGEEKEYRREYFRQLFRLQAELVKLPD